MFISYFLVNGWRDFMRVNKVLFVLSVTLVILLSCFSFCFASSPYIWSASSAGLLETVSDTETDLKLESGGAILIEQSTRLCFV